MQCMKCGRDIEPEQAFCPDCLAEMEKYPVKPGTVVTIPRQPAPNHVKKQTNTRRHPAIPPEMQIRKLKKRVAVLACALALALAALAGLGWLTVSHHLDELDEFLPGQNYSSATPAEPQTTE